MDAGSPPSTSKNSTAENNTQEINLMQTNEQAQVDQLVLLALQERLAAQQAAVRPQNLDLQRAVDAQRLWSLMLTGLPGLFPLNIPGLSSANQVGLSHPLYQHNVCSWPQCGQPCENIGAFLHHLSTSHMLDERGTQQCRAQIEIVDNLEHQLTKEKLRLEAMLQHLQMKQSPETTTTSINNMQSESPLVSPSMIETKPEPMQFDQQPDVSTPILQANTSTGCEEQRILPTRKRVSDKSVVPMAGDLVRNRDYYRNNDVRPPYTYASLIRQAIMESKDCQLTLNEIYQWFTESFAYFRRNAATWKNAVRHNLSLHKCFARVEQNVKGAVWTVDDSEFYRRRPQRSHAARSTPPTPKSDNPLSLLSTAATASITSEDLLRSAMERPQEQSRQSFISNNLLTDSESLSDKNTRSPGRDSQGTQPLSTFETYIKEEQLSPRLVVDEES